MFIRQLVESTMPYRFLILAFFAFCLSQGSKASGVEYAVLSPDGKVMVKLVCDDSRLSYSLSWNERVIFQNSELSLVPNAKYSVIDAETRSVNSTWKTVWGQFSTIEDRGEELVLTLNASGIQANLICRVYNDGLGFRFVVPQGQAKTHKELSFVCEYQSAIPLNGWYPNGESEPIGPELFGSKGKRPMPAVIDASHGVYLGLLESDLYSAKGFEIAVLAESRSESNATLTNQGMITPWRVILWGAQPGALLTSTVPLNLAAKCQLDDTSWIKAGKCLWDWRVHGYKTGDFTYGINTASYKRFIDFAADNHIPYFLIDDSWFDKVVDGKMIIKPEVDLQHVMDHAKKKNVEIILYYDRHKGASLEDQALFKLYSDFGAVGIKYGFMGNKAQFTREAVEQAAANRLIIDFHDLPCPMTGISRTLPNAVTREFCHAQQDTRKAFSPSEFLKMSMINALSGPLDQCNGAYDLHGINQGEREKGPIKKDSYNSTVVSETARTLVIFSGLITLPDAPEEYQKKADLFEFIRHMPATWDESRVIHSKIGEHITTARRHGDQWFVGSVINEQSGTLSIPLDFLEKGRTYTVTFYEDAPETHFVKNREAYRIRKGQASSNDVIEAILAPGGGHCMWIRPE
jgi:alpha-glucosidase